MSVSRITWQDLQQAPEDSRHREAIGGETVDEVNLEEVFGVG